MWSRTFPGTANSSKCGGSPIATRSTRWKPGPVATWNPSAAGRRSSWSCRRSSHAHVRLQPGAEGAANPPPVLDIGVAAAYIPLQVADLLAWGLGNLGTANGRDLFGLGSR